MGLTIELTMTELRAVSGFALACAEPVLGIFERHRPNDDRPRQALEEARLFATGGSRTKALRVVALEAHRAAREADEETFQAAAEAARAAGHAAASAYLHPLAKATQVKHILGSGAHAARAAELHAGDNPDIGCDYIRRVSTLAPRVVGEVLKRYPTVPESGRRVGELLRELDASLRSTT